MQAATLIREIRKRNPDMSESEISKICGVSKQYVHQILTQKKPEKWAPKRRPSYEAEVKYVREVIPKRGRIWEGCRPAFESGEYYEENLDRMLREGVIVPDSDPKGGYILPTTTP